jgi:hypothetical protein
VSVDEIYELTGKKGKAFFQMLPCGFSVIEFLFRKRAAERGLRRKLPGIEQGARTQYGAGGRGKHMVLQGIPVELHGKDSQPREDDEDKDEDSAALLFGRSI